MIAPIGTDVEIPLNLHPSREEWAARKSNLPEPARVALAGIAERKTQEATERAIQAAREDAESFAWRNDFEAAIAALLVEVGAEWLVPYRVRFTLQPEFRGTSTFYYAEFDGSAAGVWPIRLQLEAGTGHARQWRPLLGGAFKVVRPAGPVTFKSFAGALAWAAEYCATPF